MSSSTDPHASSTKICHDVLVQTGSDISERTVRRRLSSDFGLIGRRPAKKPLMTEKQRKQRIAFCKKYRKKTADWWERVMFSDESTFQQERGTGSNYIRRPKGERFNPKYTVKTVKHPPSCMVWGAITAHGGTGLVVFGRNEKVNASCYLKVLEERVKLHMDITDTTIFQQDSAPCHTAKVVKKWFQDNDVELLEDWPSNSADLNVIENCWSTMKKCCSAFSNASTKCDQSVDEGNFFWLLPNSCSKHAWKNCCLLGEQRVSNQILTAV